nr:nucleoside-diphosphate sugar epimerase/dehydratase [Thiohalomonas denitrificans]
MILSDFTGIPIALWLAFSARYGTLTPPVGEYTWLFIAVPLITLPVFIWLGLYRAIVRFMGMKAAITVLQGITLSSLLLGALVLLSGIVGVPRSVPLIYWALALIYVSGTRFAVRAYLFSRFSRNPARDPVAIYGAGTAGAQLAQMLEHSSDYEPIAFIDDNPVLTGSFVNSIEVLGPENIRELAEEMGLTDVLLAMPRLTRTRRVEILENLEPYRVHVRTIPGLDDLVSGAASLDEIREIDIEDLLGRDPIAPDPKLLTACITGKTVMVSGAGGSIGSELCRQILAQRPSRLVLYEMSEFALYAINRELEGFAAENSMDIPVEPVLGSVQDKSRLKLVMNNFQVDTIYHAAAYKHVPLVEHNLIEGIRNNAFGTRQAAEVAVECGVSTFVLISTDKAVRPTNVMGASKRLAELILQAQQERVATMGSRVKTRFCMVRFGNVLGSSGSVVPLFREQIHNGGPVTVTHPDITRYFMTIREAAQLVLQASSMAKGGEVFVLDMGEPVRIDNLAQKMIRLSGLEVRDAAHPNGDIAIEYTGLRPGEKLYEELLIDENPVGTDHPLIWRAVENYTHRKPLTTILDRLELAISDNDCEKTRQILEQLVNEYAPSGDIVDKLWCATPRVEASPKVTALH